jgi:MOSC domain-containing protein YiiM
MKLVSVNVGLPRDLVWKGRTVTPGIFKQPVEGRVALRMLNLDGDRQADLSVHGGPDKAVYAYPVEHYDYWRTEVDRANLSGGMFGENFSTQGLNEDALMIGDRFKIGSVKLMVTQPRLPCYKLEVKFGRDDMIKRFLNSGRTGFYFAVLQEGDVGAGDAIELISRDKNNVSVADITRLYVRDKNDLEGVRRAIKVDALPESWRQYFQHRLEKASK